MIYLTMGDPYSVNIEILRRLAGELINPPVPLVLIGSYWQWQWQGQMLGLAPWEIDQRSSFSGLAPGIYFWNLDKNHLIGKPEDLNLQQRGAIAKKSLDVLQQVDLSRKTAIITAPIDKKNCQLAGFSHPGQTEFFEGLAGSNGIMILAGPRLKVGLVTNHLALSEVSAAISKQLVQEKIEALAMTLRQIYQIENPRLAVVGLNPHCGDGGMFGTEDEQCIRPAVDNMRAKGWNVTGPIPADTAFFHAYHGRYDAVLAMYHDQGLGPLKTVHFYDAVNITGGLSFLRVSPDHGPASDLYGKGLANLESFQQALHHAFRYLS